MFHNSKVLTGTAVRFKGNTRDFGSLIGAEFSLGNTVVIEE